MTDEARNQQVAPKQWTPSSRAMATAKDFVEVEDIQLHLVRYRVTCAEKRKTPQDGEWLRYLVADEKQARRDEKTKANSERRQRKWYDVAD